MENKKNLGIKGDIMNQPNKDTMQGCYSKVGVVVKMINVLALRSRTAHVAGSVFC